MLHYLCIASEPYRWCTWQGCTDVKRRSAQACKDPACSRLQVAQAQAVFMAAAPAVQELLSKSTEASTDLQVSRAQPAHLEYGLNLVCMLPSLNCLVKRVSLDQKRRMSGMSNSTMARRSSPSLQGGAGDPHAWGRGCSCHAHQWLAVSRAVLTSGQGHHEERHDEGAMPQVLGEGAAHKQLRPHTYKAETPCQQALPLRICAVTKSRSWLDQPL